MAELSPDEFNLLGQALTDLYGEARPRPDLGTGKTATFMGRVVRPGEGIAGILARRPQETPDAEGLSGVGQILGDAARVGAGGLGAILAAPPAAVRRVGSKVFRDAATGPVAKSGPKEFAELAKPGVRPLTDSHKMWPALIDERTGKVIHAMQPGIGLHEAYLYPAAKGMPNFIPTRGFVDPVTFQAFTEKMLESLRQY